MPKKSSREKTPVERASPPPLPAKARTKRAAAASAAAAEASAAQTSALEQSPRKTDKKDKKEKPTKSAKSGTLSRRNRKKRHDSDDGDEDSDGGSEIARRAVEEMELEIVLGVLPTPPTPWTLPGVLAPHVRNTYRALLEASLFALSSTVLSRVARYGVTRYAISSPSFMDRTGWGTLLRISAVQGNNAFFAAYFARLFKHAAGWDDVYAVAALNVLISAPIIYLQSAFYEVPFLASVFAELIDFASDLLPLLVYKKLIRPASPLGGDALISRLDLVPPEVSLNLLLIAVSGTMYNLILAQSGRSFLPRALVLHFPGISTVEPAHMPPFTFGWIFAQASIVFAIIQSPRVVAVSAVCGYAAWVYVFCRLNNPTGALRSTAFKAIFMRALAVSLTVGLGVFVRCFTGIYSVDATGAALFDIMWMLPPLWAGSLIGYIVSF